MDCVPPGAIWTRTRWCRSFAAVGNGAKFHSMIARRTVVPLACGKRGGLRWIRRNQLTTTIGQLNAQTAIRTVVALLMLPHSWQRRATVVAERLTSRQMDYPVNRNV